jgi:putative ATPase
MADSDPPSLFEVDDASRPLADRLRPTTLGHVVGQEHLLGPDAPLGRMVAQQKITSTILWGPPGCGKTTIARLLAERTSLKFETLSATFSGVADLRKVFSGAVKRREIRQGTLLFVDEIHRQRVRTRYHRPAPPLGTTPREPNWAYRHNPFP